MSGQSVGFRKNTLRIANASISSAPVRSSRLAASSLIRRDNTSAGALGFGITYLRYK
jgi:hypothetical protein